MKKYTIIADSSCDLRSTDIQHENIQFITTPIIYNIGGVDHYDEEDVNVTEMLEKMKASKTWPKTACPSPETFADQMRSAHDNVIVVTLSSKISGTNQSANLAAETVRAEQPKKKIFILDSLSCSGGMARIIFKLVDLINEGKLSFEEITETVQKYRKMGKIRFLLNDLTNLVKSGRMSKVAGIVTSIIPIKLICGDNGEGEIKKVKSVIGFKKGIEQLAELPGEHLELHGKENIIVITHCNNEESAGVIRKILESKFGYNNIKTLLMRGVASVMANEKGISVAY